MLRLMDVFLMLLKVLTTSATSSTAWGMPFLMVHNLGLTNASMISSFNDQEIVALSGAHALGRCHTNRYVLSPPYVVLIPILFPYDSHPVGIQLWVRRTLDFLAHYHDKRLLHSARQREVAMAEVGWPQAVRGLQDQGTWTVCPFFFFLYP
jgi:hypothetical protein